jgi:hypothetical protein
MPQAQGGLAKNNRLFFKGEPMAINFISKLDFYFKSFTYLSLFVGLSGLGIAGCGSSSGTSSTGTSGGGAGASGGTGTALSVAERVSVVDSDSSSSLSESAFSMSGLNFAVGALPAASHYNTDQAITFMEERSADAFDIVNEVLCYMDQTSYDDTNIVNAGDYKAQINAKRCRTERDNAQTAGQDSQNQTSGSNAPDYEFWTVNSFRESDTANHIVSFWVEMEEEFGTGLLKGKTTITEGKSSTNPYGLFHMDFINNDSDTGTELFSGYMESVAGDDDSIVLRFYNNGTFGGQGSMLERIAMTRSADGSSGSGSIAFSESFGGFGETGSFNVAYNSTHFMREDENSNQVCLSRATADLSSTTWRYNLYYDENAATPGQRVRRNSGFPIRFEADNGSDYFGFIGFWGLHLPTEAGVESGDTVVRQTFGASGATEDEYTVMIANGRLIKNTKQTVTLDEIAAVPLEWWNCSGESCSQSRIKWNKALAKFQKTATFSEQNFLWTELDTPTDITFSTNDWDLSFWSNALGGSGRVEIRDENGSLKTLIGTDSVVFFTESVVQPGDTVPSSLYCFEQCPDPSAINTSSPYIAASSFENQGSTFADSAQSRAPSSLIEDTDYAAYTFNTTSMLLERGGSNVVQTTSPGESSQHNWGIRTGALIEPSAANLTALACDWDANATCTWNAYNDISTFYTWETGTQNWNKLTLLLDSNGDALSFDPPLPVQYTDGDGRKFNLEYGGVGDLWGIPGKCIDMDSGTDVSCAQFGEEGDDGDSQQKNIRWVNEWSVPDGSSLTSLATDGSITAGDTFYVKGMEKEQRMGVVPAADCTAAGLTLTTFDLPDATGYTAPDIGTQPTITNAPAVIDGEYQGD